METTTTTQRLSFWKDEQALYKVASEAADLQAWLNERIAREQLPELLFSIRATGGEKYRNLNARIKQLLDIQPDDLPPYAGDDQQVATLLQEYMPVISRTHTHIARTMRFRGILMMASFSLFVLPTLKNKNTNN
jgi:hypothetical protein